VNPVTLHDGRQVDSSSEEWRLECEATTVLSWPSIPARRAYLARVEEKRGKEAAYALTWRIKDIWAARKAAREAGRV
jgi:hypothetical protein